MFYFEEEDNNKEESINKYKELFSEYKNNKPSLQDALKQMFLSVDFDKNKTNDLIDDIISKCKSKIDEIFDKIIIEKYPNITKDDAYIICSYTCESKETENGEEYSPYSPYRLLNQNMISNDRKKGINNISKYLYILLDSLRKLEIYQPYNNTLYRCITNQVNIFPEPNNDKFVPYIIGNQKTFWGFTSTSPNPAMTYGFLKEDDQKIKTGTIFVLNGYIWGYDITLFNAYNENEILIEPERKFKITSVLPPINGIITIHCNILKTPLILDDYNISEKIYNQLNINNFIENNINDIKSQCICEIKMEIKEGEKYKFISGMGILCNIKDKNMKALITNNNIINLDILINESKLIYFKKNNQKKEIDLKKNRFKYSYSDLNITIIEIFEDEENINNFIVIDDYIKSRDYKDEKIILIEYNKNNMDNKIKCINDKIKEYNNNNYICYENNNIYEGIIILQDNLKLIGLINRNYYQSIITIINKINYIKGIYEIKNDYIGKNIQIINNQNNKVKKINEEILRKIKIIVEGEIKMNILKYTFTKEGLYQIYIFSDDILTNLSYMFRNCYALKELYLSSFNTNKVINMESMFEGCSGLKELNLSSFNTNNVTNMESMFEGCSGLKELNLSTFNTRKVTNLSFMFFNCSELKELNLSSFDTSQLTKMRCMFAQCSELKELNLSSFNTNQVKNMECLFTGCSGLKILDLSSFNTDKVTNMYGMFYGCSGLEELNLSSFNAAQVTHIYGIFDEVPGNCKIECNDCIIKEKINSNSFCIIW